ncbi:MAG: twin transmembrane helix small protein [Proteobacteria bacterium]|nr:twin transmembrane helix small protein [Pseudomonadota bacterium]
MIYILIFFALATLGVLIAGIILMAKGGKANKKYSNRLMMARVLLQGCAVLLLGLMFMMKH